MHVQNRLKVTQKCRNIYEIFIYEISMNHFGGTPSSLSQLGRTRLLEMWHEGRDGRQPGGEARSRRPGKHDVHAPTTPAAPK